MGAWLPDFVARHHAFVARIDGRAAAFLTRWRSGRGEEWMVDLMRQTQDAPDGVMHALMLSAIEAAGADGAAGFNLCMSPLSGLDRLGPVTPLSRVLRHVDERGAARQGLKGLRRFKETYRPGWPPRHLVTPRARRGRCRGWCAGLRSRCCRWRCRGEAGRLMGCCRPMWRHSGGRGAFRRGRRGWAAAPEPRAGRFSPQSGGAKLCARARVQRRA